MTRAQPDSPAACDDIAAPAAWSPGHELFTPMNGIIGMLDALLGSGLSAHQREYAERARGCAEDLLRALSDILDFSTIAAGRLGLEASTFSLRKTIEAAVDGCRDAARECGVVLSLRDDGADADLIGSPQRIRQVAASLMRAAIRAVPRAPVELMLTCDARGEDCEFALAIRSHASVAELDLEVSGETALQAGCAELNLAQCRRLLLLMGGQLERNADGSHTTIVMRLRLPRAARAAALQPNEPRRLLYLVGDPNAAQAIDCAGDELGWHTQAASSVDAALAALEQAAAAQQPFGLLLCDRQMPGIDAETLAAALRADPRHRDMRLAVLAADAAPADAGAGADFAACLRLPLSKEALTDTLRRLAAPADAAPSALHNFAGRRVLVVDDVPINIEVAARLLETLGCEVDRASGGEQAVAMQAKQPYDLILMDCQMPGLDGYQATARIRASEAGTRTPIVALTAHALAGERERCLAAGMDDFLAKPVRMDSMRDTLGRWLAPSDNDRRDCALEEMRDMFASDFDALALLFVTDSRKRIAQLQESTATGDADDLARVAHSLAGSCASIGATGLATLCKEFELACRAGELAGAASRVTAIATEFSRIQAKLAAMCGAVAQI